MKTKQELTNDAVLYFAKKYGQGAMFENMKCSLPRFVEMIVYEMFLQKFNFVTCMEQDYEHYKIIHDYASELRENGWVE